jgi:hypothetical protein
MSRAVRFKLPLCVTQLWQTTQPYDKYDTVHEEGLNDRPVYFPNLKMLLLRLIRRLRD